MIYIKTYLEKYDWNIYVYVLINQEDVNNIDILFSKHNIPKQIMNKASYRLTEYNNSGIIYNDRENKSSIIIVSQTDSIQDLVNTITHEKNHLEMYLCDYYNINPNSEEASILSGDIAQLLFLQLVRQLTKYQV